MLCSKDCGEDYSCRVWSREDENRTSWFQSPDNGGVGIKVKLVKPYFVIVTDLLIRRSVKNNNNVFKSPKFTRTQKKMP